MASVLGTASSANAVLLRYEFSGVIRDVVFQSGDFDVATDYLDSVNANVGAAFSGYYVVDTNVADTNSSPDTGTYLQGAVDFGLRIGDIDGESIDEDNGSSRIVAVNNGSSGDLWGLAFTSLFQLDDRIATSIFDLLLVDSSGAALTSDDSDQMIPDLAAFDAYDPTAAIFSGLGLFLSIDQGNAVFLRGALTSHRLVVVPVPGALWLFAGALVFLRPMTRLGLARKSSA
ncbi:MAG: hypothetical protein AB8G17_01170 [Gammaproteobacteria bacterium]